MEYRIEVDNLSCETNGLCESIAPDVFTIDDSETVLIRSSTVSGELVESVRMAVERCPKQALALIEVI